MDSKLVWSIIIFIGAFVMVAGLWFVIEKRRRQRLQQRFGPEYDRTVRELGNARRAEAVLDARTRRVERLRIQPLSAADAARFAEAWRQLQNRFVDEPQPAVAEADRVVGEVMTARGYPLGDFDQRAADISVGHPQVVVHYRAAREIARRQGRGEASTEELRQALVHYRALFEDLLDFKEPASTGRPVQDDRDLVRGRR
jgi:hypothetical protein